MAFNLRKTHVMRAVLSAYHSENAPHPVVVDGVSAVTGSFHKTGLVHTHKHAHKHAQPRYLSVTPSFSTLCLRSCSWYTSISSLVRLRLMQRYMMR